MCLLKADETAPAIIEFLVDNLESLFEIGEVLALCALGNGFRLGTLLLALLHIIRYLEDALVHRGDIVKHGVVEDVI